MPIILHPNTAIMCINTFTPLALVIVGDTPEWCVDSAILLH